MKSSYKIFMWLYMLIIFIFIIIFIDVKGTIAEYGMKQAMDKGYTAIEAGIDNSEFMSNDLKELLKQSSPENK